GTALAGLRRPEAFRRALEDMLSPTPSSCRRLGALLGANRMTVWRWRQRVLAALEGMGAHVLGGIVEADEKFFRESRKGSREWVNHARDPARFPRVSDLLCMTDRVHASPKGSMHDDLQGTPRRTAEGC